MRADVLHRFHVDQVASEAMCTCSAAQQRRPVVPGHVRCADHVVAVQGGDRDEGEVPDVELAANAVNSAAIPERGLVVADQVHLVHREHQVGHPEQGGEEGVAPALLVSPLRASTR